MLRRLCCLCLLLSGCVGSAKVVESDVEPTSAPDMSEVSQEDHVAWIIREAALPEGFPPPNPPGEVTVKRYPAYRAAVARIDAEGASQNRLFNRLFAHIKRSDIAMTAPVEMTYDGSGPNPYDFELTAMAFMYRSPSQGRTGVDENVQVIDIPAATMLSIAVRGGYNSPKLEKARDKLLAYLREHEQAYQPAGPLRVLAYNSPFVPAFLRYNEVQLPVSEQPHP